MKGIITYWLFATAFIIPFVYSIITGSLISPRWIGYTSVTLSFVGGILLFNIILSGLHKSTQGEQDG